MKQVPHVAALFTYIIVSGIILRMSTDAFCCRFDVMDGKQTREGMTVNSAKHFDASFSLHWWITTFLV